ncbi:MAG: hypothetical protein D6704_07320 [Nitrospirae bacterium]|nr:MAG: hypothetical protein D6704_07320 [Nitrospirota bacterium]
MIKLIREGAKKYPWILKIVMLVVAVTFIVGMGWFGYEQSQRPNAVALVGPYQITLQDFRRAFNNTYRFYRDQLKQEKIDEEMLKHVVIGGLVDSTVWTLAADELDLDVSEQELRRAIMARKEFQKDGKFNPQFYYRLLAMNHLTPKQYEAQRIKDLLAEKAKFIVQDVAALTPSEQKEVQELAARQTAEVDDEAEIAKVRERIRWQLLFQKKQRALQAFQAALREKAHVEVREEYL